MRCVHAVWRRGKRQCGGTVRRAASPLQPSFRTQAASATRGCELSLTIVTELANFEYRMVKAVILAKNLNKIKEVMYIDQEIRLCAVKKILTVMYNMVSVDFHGGN